MGLEKVFDLLFIASAHFDRRIVMQNQMKLTVHVSTNLFDPVQIDDCTAMYSLEI